MPAALKCHRQVAQTGVRARVAAGAIIVDRAITRFVEVSGAVLLGVGTAMVYPTLLAAIGDVAHPTWRASSVGVYRLWRDGGFAVGALLAGGIADLFGIAAAIWTVAVITAASGVVVAVRMYETHSRVSNQPIRPVGAPQPE